eukprot:1306615-Prymnesium_polylepis.1
MPFRCCHNCGMMNYPASGDRILVRASGLDDLRAWRVYGPMVEHFCRQQNIDRGEVFLCEEAPSHPSDGHDRRRVFACTACKKEVCQDPTKYDLFDGHMLTTAQADGDMMRKRRRHARPRSAEPSYQ